MYDSDWEDLIKSPEHCEQHFNFLKFSCKEAGVNLEKSTRILEIGSGNGVFINHLKELGFTSIQGIDINPRHTQSFPHLEVTKGRIDNMPFEDNSFDIVVSKMVFDLNVYDWQDTDKMMKEIQRVLVPDGLYTGTEFSSRVLQEYINGKVFVVLNAEMMKKREN